MKTEKKGRRGERFCCIYLSVICVHVRERNRKGGLNYLRYFFLWEYVKKGMKEREKEGHTATIPFCGHIGRNNGKGKWKEKMEEGKLHLSLTVWEKKILERKKERKDKVRLNTSLFDPAARNNGKRKGKREDKGRQNPCYFSSIGRNKGRKKSKKRKESKSIFPLLP